jgi:hypothetical protein
MDGIMYFNYNNFREHLFFNLFLRESYYLKIIYELADKKDS